MVPIEVQFFGYFEVLCASEAVPLRRNSRAQTILKWIVINRPQPVSRHYLMGWLWPESNSTKARWSLNSSIYTLRKVLKNTLPAGTDTNVIVQEHGHYFLDPDICLWVDKDEFERHVALARRYEKEQRSAEAMASYEAAIKLYRGDYLIEDLYEDWTMIERERLSRLYLSALGSLAHYYNSSQHYYESIQLCYGLLQKDRCNEQARALLEESYEGLGLHKPVTSVRDVSQYIAMSMPFSAKYQIG